MYTHPPVVLVKVLYESRKDFAHTIELTRVPCVGEIVEAPAPLRAGALRFWEVTRVVHFVKPDMFDHSASITVKKEDT